MILVTTPLVIRRQQHGLVYPAEQFDQPYVRTHLGLEEDHTVQITEDALIAFSINVFQW